MIARTSVVVPSIRAIAACVVVMVICGGCSDKGTSQEKHKRPAVSSGGTGIESVKPKAVPGPTVSNPVNRNTKVPASSQNPGDGKFIRNIEPITSTGVPSEYLFLNSQNIADAVVAVTLPVDYATRPQKTYPLVIVFGGAGECVRPPREGALAWVGYYKMDDAIRALTAGHLDSKDFRGLVTRHRLAAFNIRLNKWPYEGLIVACPYSPPITSLTGFEDNGYERFIVQELIPALKKRYRVTTGAVGVDGVSMGGARSMFFGLKYPQIFSSIGSVQGAFGPFLETYADLAHKNRDKLRGVPIQLVTSDGDGMAISVKKMAGLLKDEGIPYIFMNLTGPHDYIFNQGPGSIALLMFHAQVQRRRSKGPTR